MQCKENISETILIIIEKLQNVNFELVITDDLTLDYDKYSLEHMELFDVIPLFNSFLFIICVAF